MNPLNLLLRGTGATLPLFGPEIFMQGQEGSMTDKILKNIDAQKKAPDLGRQVGDAFRGFVGLPPQVAPGAIVKPKKERFRTEKRIGALGIPYEVRIPLEGTYGAIPPTVNTNFAAYDEGVTLPATARKSAGNAGSYVPPVSTVVPPIDPNQDLPASAEQSVDNTPFQHQMALYDQGRRAATTQAERNQVRDLGLAIHKAHNPHLYSDFQVPMKTDRLFNPTLRNQPTAVFPDGYPETLEAYIKEGGVQMPYTMTDKDARNEVIEANRLEGQQAAAALAQELQAQEFMKAFMKRQGAKK